MIDDGPLASGHYWCLQQAGKRTPSSPSHNAIWILDMLKETRLCIHHEENSCAEAKTGLSLSKKVIIYLTSALEKSQAEGWQTMSVPFCFLKTDLSQKLIGILYNPIETKNDSAS